MRDILVTCPYCGFYKQMKQLAIPPGVTRLTCPRCKENFSLEAATVPVAESPLKGTVPKPV